MTMYLVRRGRPCSLRKIMRSVSVYRAVRVRARAISGHKCSALRVRSELRGSLRLLA